MLQCLATVRQTWRLGGSLTRFMMETPIPVVLVPGKNYPETGIKNIYGKTPAIV